MKNIICFLGMLLLFSVSFGATIEKNQNVIPDNIFKKAKITIVVTDSGLGGLSVVAGMAQKFEKEHPFQNVELIFVNALASLDYPYNMMQNSEEKVRVFNSALEGMSNKYKPDIIFIACNTLSVLYPKTKYAQVTKIPVIEIVNFGVDLLFENLSKNPNNRGIIFGTNTTITQSSHKQELVKRGINEEQIITQSCEMLESEIQADASSDMVHSMIEMYVDESFEKLASGDSASISVCLCCTHYTYAYNIFEKVLFAKTNHKIDVYDPNIRMSEFLFENMQNNKYDTTIVNIKVVSQAEISNAEKDSVGKILENMSFLTAEALQEYILDKQLFSY